MSATEKRNLILSRAGTLVLWLVFCALGLIAIYSIIQLSVVTYGYFASMGKQSVASYYTGVLTGQVMALISGGIWLVAVIWSGEYAIKHVGERRLWKIFAWMLGIELVLIFIAWTLNLL